MANRKPKRIKNVGIAGVFVPAGCMGLVIALFALLTGLWLDNLTGKRGLATISLLVLSVPVNLYLMTKLSFVFMRYIQPLQPEITIDDEEEV